MATKFIKSISLYFSCALIILFLWLVLYCNVIAADIEEVKPLPEEYKNCLFLYQGEVLMYSDCSADEVMGSTITSINPTDYISNSWATINTNDTNLNTDKLEHSDISGGAGITYSSGAISFDCSEVAGLQINCVGEAITLDATGDWTGTLDGYEASALLGGEGSVQFLSHVGDVSTSTLGTGYIISYQGSEWQSTSSLYVDSSNNIGIGTTSPEHELDVAGTIQGNTLSVTTIQSQHDNSIYMITGGDADDYFSFKTIADRPTMKREGGKFIYFESSNVYDVGISFRENDTYSGTLNYEKDNQIMTMLGKASKLGFKANSDYDDYILIQTASNIPEITVASSSGLKINAGGTNALLLNAAGGFVGIGTTSPNYTLDINGDIYADNHYGDISTANLNSTVLSGALFVTMKDFMKISLSAGKFDGGGEITDNGDGTVAIAELSGSIRTTASSLGELKSFTLTTESSFGIKQGELDYIYIDYNGGSLIYATTTVRTDINGWDKIAVGLAYNDGSLVHTLTGGIQIDDIGKRTHQRAEEMDGFKRSSGLVVSENGTRGLSMTTGVYWRGNTRFPTSASSTITFSTWYNDGAWQETTGQTTISNTQYNDYGTGLDTVTPNQYGVHYVYMHFEGDYHVVYGIDSYTLAGAEAEGTPANLPDIVSAFSVPLAKVIVKRDDTNFTDVIALFENGIGQSPITDHGALGGLTDDDHTQYALDTDLTSYLDLTTWYATTTDAITQGSTNLYNQTHSGEVTGATTLTIADNIIDEANFKINSATDDYVLTASSTASGGIAWEEAAAGGGAGDVTKVGTPVNNQVGIWTGDGTLEGDVDLVFDGTNLGIGTSSPTHELTLEGQAHIYGNYSSTDAGLTITNSGYETGDKWVQFVDDEGTEQFSISKSSDANNRVRITVGEGSGNMYFQASQSVFNKAGGAKLQLEGDNGDVHSATTWNGHMQLTTRGAGGYTVRIGTQESPAMYFIDGGNIGVDDSTPDGQFEIAGTNDDGYFLISSAAGNDGDVLIVDSSGNLGVGTTTPSESISTNGNMIANGYIEFSEKYDGKALEKVKNIKCEDNTKEGDWCKIDHNTLPEGIKYEKDYAVQTKIGTTTKSYFSTSSNVLVTEEVPIYKEETRHFVGRNLGNSVQFNLKAIQELLDRVEVLEGEVKILKDKDKVLGAVNNDFTNEEKSMLRKLIDIFKSLFN